MNIRCSDYFRRAQDDDIHLTNKINGATEQDRERKEKEVKEEPEFGLSIKNSSKQDKRQNDGRTHAASERTNERSLDGWRKDWKRSKLLSLHPSIFVSVAVRLPGLVN